MESVIPDCAQGVSGAGLQQGMSDDRSGLIREVFRVFDSLDHPERLGDHSLSFMQSIFSGLQTIAMMLVPWFQGASLCLRTSSRC